jgi:hypothetical protein
MKKLFEILVPTIYGDTIKPIKTRHHKNWDKFVRNISAGLTILTPAKGQWVFKNELFEERVIPVRIFCTEEEMKKIVAFSFLHYRQKAIMYYVISSECRIEYQ